MDAYKRQQKIAEQIQLVNSKINHLKDLLKETNNAVNSCTEKIKELEEQFKKETHNEH
jgi:hypothetical protein